MENKIASTKNYIYCQLMRHYDVTDSMQMCADNSFACWYRKFRNVIELRNPVAHIMTQVD